MPTAISIRANSGRELLIANRIYYVRTDGNDVNNGLSNTSGGAFLTIQKAVDTACGLDLGIYNVTIQIADGTYVGATALKTLIGAGKVIIRGNLVTPSNVVIQTIGNAPLNGIYANFESIAFGSTYALEGFTLVSSGSSWRAILVNNPGSTIEYKNIIVSSGFIRQICSFGGQIKCTGSYTITAGSACHWENDRDGKLIVDPTNAVIALQNTPNFTAYFLLSASSYNYVASFSGYVAFSGSATGSRYGLFNYAICTGTQNNPSFLPGNTASGLVSNSIYE